MNSHAEGFSYWKLERLKLLLSLVGKVLKVVHLPLDKESDGAATTFYPCLVMHCLVVLPLSVFSSLLATALNETVNV